MKPHQFSSKKSRQDIIRVRCIGICTSISAFICCWKSFRLPAEKFLPLTGTLLYLSLLPCHSGAIRVDIPVSSLTLKKTRIRSSGIFWTSASVSVVDYCGRLRTTRYCSSSLEMGKVHKIPSGDDNISRHNVKKKARTLTAKPAIQEKESIATPLLQSWVAHTHDSFHDFSPEEAKAVRRSLLSWYAANRRKLPWRGDVPPYTGSTAKSKSRAITSATVKGQTQIRSFFAPKPQEILDGKALEIVIMTETAEEAYSGNDGIGKVTAYGIWVSEIMLQQTRVEAVIPYYLKWMERFPTVQALAAASEEDVNAHWAGLGFYRRARFLHQGAKAVVNKFNGTVPSTVEELLLLDGIGRYTASAIASFAYNASVPVVDGNVCRVLSRLRGIANHIKSPALKDNMGWRLAMQLVTPCDDEDKGSFSAGDVNQALMELGATFCAPSGIGIDPADPLKDFYFSTRIGKEVGLNMFQNNGSYMSSLTVLPDMRDECRTQSPSRPQPSGCKLCDTNGIATVLHQIVENIELEQNGSTLQVDRLSCIGHSAFPTAPPKKEKREEIIAIAAISVFDGSHNLERWLMVKRPKDGLLAGQWEFPSTCMWVSNNKKNDKEKCDGKIKSVPFVASDARKTAIDSLVGELISSKVVKRSIKKMILQCSRACVGDQPIEHIFSHVRHTMWIEYGKIEYRSPVGTNSELERLEWETAQGKTVRLMTENDMKSVGTTAGIKKVLAAVKKERSKVGM